MKPIDYFLIALGVLIVCGIVVYLIINRVKKKNVGCGCGCSGCSGCPSASACGGACPSKQSPEQEEKQEESHTCPHS